MAHGFSGVREMFLDNFASRFAAAGFVVVVFDYRHLGTSEGEARSQIFPTEQQEDYKNAITSQHPRLSRIASPGAAGADRKSSSPIH